MSKKKHHSFEQIQTELLHTDLTFEQINSIYLLHVYGALTSAAVKIRLFSALSGKEGGWGAFTDLLEILLFLLRCCIRPYLGQNRLKTTILIHICGSRSLFDSHVYARPRPSLRAPKWRNYGRNYFFLRSLWTGTLSLSRYGRIEPLFHDYQMSMNLTFFIYIQAQRDTNYSRACIAPVIAPSVLVLWCHCWQADDA